MDDNQSDHKLTAIDLTPALRDEIATALARCGIGFVKILHDESDAFAAGSGTLVTYADRFGILTADHVLEKLPICGEIGLILPVGPASKLQRVTIAIEHTQRVTVGPASHNSNGPDIGVLLLSRNDARRLESEKPFYNLQTRQRMMLSSPPPISDGGWFISGFPAEWSGEEQSERNFTKVKIFGGICGAGVVTREESIGDFDYLHFEVNINNNYEGPHESFQGVSGGALWQIELKKTADTLRVARSFLSGVVFYESPISDGKRIIYCHGRRSIYKNVCEMMMHVTMA